MTTPIPLQKPYLTGAEIKNIAHALEHCDLAGNDLYTKRCRAWLEEHLGGQALITQSGTAGLEICALVCDLGAQDEVIMPAFTFPSTANAVALRGGVPVFVDIRPDTLNIDEAKIEEAITDRTKAIMVVHYAGVACEMEAINEIAHKHGLLVIEDAAHALGASYRGKPLGAWGDMAAFSFHATKNIVAGQGGAFVCQDRDLFARAETILEKGTDRSAFLRGDVQKYCWQTLGSAYLPSEITTAVLAAQLEGERHITTMRLSAWKRYYDLLAGLERYGHLIRPIVTQGSAHNAHIFYVLLPSRAMRDFVLDGFRGESIGAAFHYVPLHDAPAGQRYARAADDLSVTKDAASRLLRLPLYSDISASDQDRVIDVLTACTNSFTARAAKMASA